MASMEHYEAPSTDDPNAPRVLVKVEEAARLLSISRSTAYALIGAGDLESVTIGRARRVPADAIESFVTRLREEASAP